MLVKAPHVSEDELAIVGGLVLWVLQRAPASDNLACVSEIDFASDWNQIRLQTVSLCCSEHGENKPYSPTKIWLDAREKGQRWTSAIGAGSSIEKLPHFLVLLFGAFGIEAGVAVI